MVVMAAAFAAAHAGGCARSAPPAALAESAADDLTIDAAQARFRDGTLTCRALTQHYLRRIAAFDDDGPRINAVSAVNPQALNDADALDAHPRSERGSL